MKATPETVARETAHMGLTPVQIDGIPEGFAFERPTLTIAKREVPGGYTAYIPLSSPLQAVSSPTTKGLLTLYKQLTK